MNGLQPCASGDRAGTGGARDSPTGASAKQGQVLAAWERFAAGEDSVNGVRPNILLSWYRCRDLHKVDPYLPAAPAAHTDGEHSLQQGMIFTKLGGAAGAAAASSTRVDHTLISVTDAAGRILATWGPRACLRYGVDSSLAPRFAWSEGSSGTNGMGTALERPGIALVQGPEHWCRAFHRWSCAGIAIRDPVTHDPLAALNVSRWDDDVPEGAAQWLRRTAACLESELRDQAVQCGERLVNAFVTAEPRARGVLLALDLAGKVVIANEAARMLLGILCSQPAIDPNARLTPDVLDLHSLVERAARRADADVGWTGSAELVVPFRDDPVPAEFRPIRTSQGVVGMLLVGSENPRGEDLRAIQADVGSSAVGLSSQFPLRVAAVRGNSIVLLSPQEIRYAEADGHSVWFVTDQGRLRAATRGLDNIERQLGPPAFLRVHRRFIVNVARIREIEQGFKGTLTLTTSSHDHTAIPVSRRHSPQLRRVLGL